ncbi:glucose-1-phosphate adenylyltransferase [Ructibacterium gallinarum]|uniref:Glucose-1-phosphate adenylyltransferase n=1 Tax=Ructibacterium gallinarum TaxID=2779355 RepID=A0A9D5M179_9FIRM|nr:glucose-1-phosphate adenylyltransferase [Ructibacterium gallinarum]MBE5039563.1 glucose-1-phosphate adenylyltransferase [Ructibacterium gallinarum]
MKSKECVAMILAGGQGSRLGILTKQVAKPAVPFGGKYRIIDFPLSNCTHSGIDTVGVLTQYQPLELNTYIASGQSWDLDRSNGGIYVLPPYTSADKGEWYKGTANAIYQNLSFIAQFHPKYVVILSGDHIYKMDYNKMVRQHKKANADATIAVIEVPWDEASRFGIMNTDEDMNIIEFEEKPANPKNNLASMGVYCFSWEVLKKYLTEDENNPESSNDFGKNIIPAMLKDGLKMVAHRFDGYWKDVGTIQSLWEANMELLDDNPGCKLDDDDWRIYSKNPIKPPHYVSPDAKLKNCYITEGCEIYGEIEHSVIFEGVTIEEDAKIEDSIIMPGAVIHKNAYVYKAIVGTGAEVGEGAVIGSMENTANNQWHNSKICSEDITLLGPDIQIGDGVKIAVNSMVTADVLN